VTKLPVLLDYVASLGHAVFTKGEYNLNIIGIRTVASDANTFDDRICVVYQDEVGWVTRTWPATTDPGSYWRTHPMNVDGTAILQPGQYRGAYKVGQHRGQYDALVQRKAVTVYRDKNRDETLDMFPSTAQEGMYGINIHKAGSDSTQVNKWSAGCQVFAKEAHFDEFMSVVYCGKTKWGDSFTYTLVDQPDF